MIRAIVCSFFKMGQLSMLIYQYSVVVMLQLPRIFSICIW